MCTTVHKSIGLTIEAPRLIVVHEYGTKFAQDTHGLLYTAVTRAQKAAQLYFCD
jgi:ATP-dependent exoDNAse (exonuclease V) alpha subunit